MSNKEVFYRLAKYFAYCTCTNNCAKRFINDEIHDELTKSTWKTLHDSNCYVQAFLLTNKGGNVFLYGNQEFADFFINGETCISSGYNVFFSKLVITKKIIKEMEKSILLYESEIADKQQSIKLITEDQNLIEQLTTQDNRTKQYYQNQIDIADAKIDIININNKLEHINKDLNLLKEFNESSNIF